MKKFIVFASILIFIFFYNFSSIYAQEGCPLDSYMNYSSDALINMCSIAELSQLPNNILIQDFPAYILAQMTLGRLSSFGNGDLIRIGQGTGDEYGFLRQFPNERKLTFSCEIRAQIGVPCSTPAPARTSPPAAAGCPLSDTSKSNGDLINQCSIQELGTLPNERLRSFPLNIIVQFPNDRLGQFPLDFLATLPTTRLLQFDNSKLIQFPMEIILKFPNDRLITFPDSVLRQLPPARIREFPCEIQIQLGFTCGQTPSATPQPSESPTSSSPAAVTINSITINDQNLTLDGDGLRFSLPITDPTRDSDVQTKIDVTFSDQTTRSFFITFHYKLATRNTTATSSATPTPSNNPQATSSATPQPTTQATASATPNASASTTPRPTVSPTPTSSSTPQPTTAAAATSAPSVNSSSCPPPSSPGYDLNKDGCVNTFDPPLFVQRWKTSKYDTTIDYDNNKVLNAMDYARLRNNLNK